MVLNPEIEDRIHSDGYERKGGGGSDGDLFSGPVLVRGWSRSGLLFDLRIQSASSFETTLLLPGVLRKKIQATGLHLQFLFLSVA